MRKTILNVGIVLLVTVTLAAVAFFMYREVTSLHAEIIEAERQSFNLEDELEKIIAFRELLETTEEKRAAINTYFIKSEEETIAFLERLESLAGTLGLEFSFTIGRGTRPVVFEGGRSIEKGVLRLSMRFGGAYRDVYNFIALLERLPHKILFNTLSLRRAGATEGGVPLWNAAIELDILSSTT